MRHRPLDPQTATGDPPVLGCTSLQPQLRSQPASDLQEVSQPKPGNRSLACLCLPFRRTLPSSASEELLSAQNTAGTCHPHILGDDVRPCEEAEPGDLGALTVLAMPAWIQLTFTDRLDFLLANKKKKVAKVTRRWRDGKPHMVLVAV